MLKSPSRRPLVIASCARWVPGGAEQTAYQVRVARSPAKLAAPDVRDSGKVGSSASVNVPYGGPRVVVLGGVHGRDLRLLADRGLAGLGALSQAAGIVLEHFDRASGGHVARGELAASRVPNSLIAGSAPASRTAQRSP